MTHTSTESLGAETFERFETCGKKFMSTGRTKPSPSMKTIFPQVCLRFERCISCIMTTQVLIFLNFTFYGFGNLRNRRIRAY